MWKTDPSDEPILGLATWQHGDSAWSIDARGGDTGIRLIDADLISNGLASNAGEYCRLAAVDDANVPRIVEQFVRGDELHLSLPQAEGTFGVQLTLTPITCDADRLVLETIISIQTTLLDTHPMLDVIADAEQTSKLNAAATDEMSGAPSVSIAQQRDHSTAILLGRHDSPFTSDRTGLDRLSLRLFGDFLEKGVIRKARPWLVLSRSTTSPDASSLEALLAELNASPLPLTP
ncbi:MAG: hypothetical protein HKN47_14745 [Pirellulaceae bacterium]|nr:hypothetical protein [Pirellulaceae bacterium]